MASDNQPSHEGNSSPTPLEGPSTLCLDIGGTGLKAIVLDAAGKPLNERQRVDTPRPATTAALLAAIGGLLAQSPPFDRVSVGFPGVVKRNTVYTAPNLDEGWAGFALGAELEQLTGKPTRVLNDAGVQGYGAITGQGVEMILPLGSGMGCALFVNGTYVPNIELAHHPLKKKSTYEDYIDNKTLEEIGRKKWNKRLRRVIAQVLPIFNPDVLYLGGGNAKKIEGELPPEVKIVENIAGLLGGLALWRYLQVSVSARAARAARAAGREASRVIMGARRVARSGGCSLPRAARAAPPSDCTGPSARGTAPARARSVSQSIEARWQTAPSARTERVRRSRGRAVSSAMARSRGAAACTWRRPVASMARASARGERSSVSRATRAWSTAASGPAVARAS